MIIRCVYPYSPFKNPKCLPVSWKISYNSASVHILMSLRFFFLFFLSGSSRPRRNGKETPYGISHRSGFEYIEKKRRWKERYGVDDSDDGSRRAG